jgi:hypothetical protein
VTAESVTTTSTEIEPFIKTGTIALKEGKSLKEVADLIADPLPDLRGYVETIPFPPVPTPVVITPEVEAAIKRLPDVFNKVELSDRRQMTGEELVAVYDEWLVLKAISGLLESRAEALKEYVRTHMDVHAEEINVAVRKAQVDKTTGEVIVEATSRSNDGHYILSSKGNPERANIPTTNKAFSREFRAGTLTLDTSQVEEMFKNEELTREQYLSFTREMRVFDEDKAHKAMIDNHALLAVLKRMSVRTQPGTSLYVRKAN